MLQKSQQDRLRSELGTLQELLASTEGLDGETKAAVQQVASEIGRILEAEEAESTNDEWPSLGQRWRDAVLDFESHHPRLAQVIEQITGVLANAGI